MNQVQTESGAGAVTGSPETVEALALERAQLVARSEHLAADRQALESEQQEVERLASALEERIRQLAKEEAELQRRKRLIQEEARNVGEKRSAFISQFRSLDEQQEEIQNALDEIESRQTQAEREHQRSEAQAQEEAREQAQEQAQQQAVQAAEAPVPAAVSAEQPRTQHDKRAQPRVAVAVDVAMHSDHNFFMGLTENLSEGGLFVATYDEVPVGTELELTIQLDGHGPISSRGVVRWVREYSEFTDDVAPGVGLQLLDLADSDQQAIRQFLADRDPIYFEPELIEQQAAC